MQQQEMLAVASFEEAAKLAAMAVAVAREPRNKKKWASIVGHILFPDKDPEAAGRYLADCLNPGRDEKLSAAQIFLLSRLAKRVGCHILHNHICEESEYQVGNPIEPQDEAAELYTRAESLARDLKDCVERLERAGKRISPAPPMVR